MFNFFKKKKNTAASSGGGSSKSEGDLAKQLQQKDISQWSKQEVGIWLDLVDLSEYKQVFVENSITGTELLELTKEELDSLGVKKLGHRKKFEKLISALQKNSSITNFLENMSATSSDRPQDQQPSSNQQISHQFQEENPNGLSATSFDQGNEEVVFKCFYNGDINVFSLKHNSATYSSLKLKIIEEYHSLSPVIKYKDSDGDLITIRKEADFNFCIQNSTSNMIKLYISTDSQNSQTSNSKNSSVVSNEVEEEFEMDESVVLLDTLVDAVIIIDDERIVKYMNKSAEKMFRYKRREVINNNVKMLMPNPHRAKHDQYVLNYLNTGEAKIIGSGRMVEARAKDGVVFPIWLSIAESAWLGKHSFTATIQDLRKTKAASKFSGMTALLENLVDGCVIIDEDRLVHFFNKSAEKMFGYTRDEVLGQNVKMLMPKKYSVNHDDYVNNYIHTGKAKIIGKGRKVEALQKDGNSFPIWLSLAETQWKGETAFTATIQDLRTENNISISAEKVKV